MARWREPDLSGCHVAGRRKYLHAVVVVYGPDLHGLVQVVAPVGLGPPLSGVGEPHAGLGRHLAVFVQGEQLGHLLGMACVSLVVGAGHVPLGGDVLGSSRRDEVLRFYLQLARGVGPQRHQRRGPPALVVHLVEVGLGVEGPCELVGVGGHLAPEGEARSVLLHILGLQLRVGVTQLHAERPLARDGHVPALRRELVVRAECQGCGPLGHVPHPGLLDGAVLRAVGGLDLLRGLRRPASEHLRVDVVPRLGALARVSVRALVPAPIPVGVAGHVDILLCRGELALEVARPLRTLEPVGILRSGDGHIGRGLGPQHQRESVLHDLHGRGALVEAALGALGLQQVAAPSDGGLRLHLDRGGHRPASGLLLAHDRCQVVYPFRVRTHARTACKPPHQRRVGAHLGLLPRLPGAVVEREDLVLVASQSVLDEPAHLGGALVGVERALGHGVVQRGYRDLEVELERTRHAVRERFGHQEVAPLGIHGEEVLLCEARVGEGVRVGGYDVPLVRGRSVLAQPAYGHRVVALGRDVDGHVRGLLGRVAVVELLGREGDLHHLEARLPQPHAHLHAPGLEGQHRLARLHVGLARGLVELRHADTQARGAVFALRGPLGIAPLDLLALVVVEAHGSLCRGVRLHGPSRAQLPVVVGLDVELHGRAVGVIFLVGLVHVEHVDSVGGDVTELIVLVPREHLDGHVRVVALERLIRGVGAGARDRDDVHHIGVVAQDVQTRVFRRLEGVAVGVDAPLIDVHPVVGRRGRRAAELAAHHQGHARIALQPVVFGLGDVDRPREALVRGGLGAGGEVGMQGEHLRAVDHGVLLHRREGRSVQCRLVHLVPVILVGGHAPLPGRAVYAQVLQGEVGVAAEPLGLHRRERVAPVGVLEEVHAHVDACRGARELDRADVGARAHLEVPRAAPHREGLERPRSAARGPCHGLALRLARNRIAELLLHQRHDLPLILHLCVQGREVRVSGTPAQRLELRPAQARHHRGDEADARLALHEGYVHRVVAPVGVVVGVVGALQVFGHSHALEDVFVVRALHVEQHEELIGVDRALLLRAGRIAGRAARNARDAQRELHRLARPGTCPGAGAVVLRRQILRAAAGQHRTRRQNLQQG